MVSFSLHEQCLAQFMHSLWNECEVTWWMLRLLDLRLRWRQVLLFCLCEKKLIRYKEKNISLHEDTLSWESDFYHTYGQNLCYMYSLCRYSSVLEKLYILLHLMHCFQCILMKIKKENNGEHGKLLIILREHCEHYCDDIWWRSFDSKVYFWA